MADGLEHPLHLPLPALVQRQLDHAGSEQARLGRRGSPVLELDALAQRGERFARPGVPSTSASYTFGTP